MYFQTPSPLWLIKFTSLEIIDSDLIMTKRRKPSSVSLNDML